ncbi:hypothetical protein GCM10028819_11100 [Spirosoma humi]
MVILVVDEVMTDYLGEMLEPFRQTGLLSKENMDPVALFSSNLRCKNKVTI